MNSILSRRDFLKTLGLTVAGASCGKLARPEFDAARGHQGDHPNILLLVLDTVRAANLSLYGYSRSTTPFLDQLAGRGYVFENAFATSPWTLPSHATMFTGRWSYEHEADWSVPLDGLYPTVAEGLSDRGYRTGGFIANNYYCSAEHGLARGFDHYDDFSLSLDELLVSSQLGRTIANNSFVREIAGYHDIITRRSAETLNGRLLRWLDREKGRPFFAFVNYFEAHEPYLPPSPFDRLFGDPAIRTHKSVDHELRRGLRWDRVSMPPEQLQAEIDAYDGAIAYLDYSISQLFEALHLRGLLQDTWLVIVSDHGEQFGEHRLFGHGNSLYLPLLHVPLIIFPPEGIGSGRRVNNQVSLHELPATLLDIAAGSDGAFIPGKSIARYWEGENAAADTAVLSEVTGNFGHYDWYPIADGDLKSILANGYHYIVNENGSEELYDIHRDSMEQDNLVSNPHYGEDLGELREKMRAMVAGMGDWF